MSLATRRWALRLLPLLVSGGLGCGGAVSPSTSGKSNWIICAVDADCVWTDSYCGTSGICEVAGVELSSESASELEIEPATPLSGVWVAESTTGYTRFLRILGTSGFLCYNDGKSDSSNVRIEYSNADDSMRTGEIIGERSGTVETFALSVADGEELLTLRFEEDGEVFVQAFKRGERPDLCARLEAGETPTFEEYEATWTDSEE